MQALQEGQFNLKLFPDDEGSLWLDQGAHLYRLANDQAPADQELGSTYLSWMIYRAQLDTLAQARMVRIDLKHRGEYFNWWCCAPQVYF